MWPNTGAQGLLQGALKTLSTVLEGMLGLFFGKYCGVWTAIFMAGVGRPAVLDQWRYPPWVHHVFPPSSVGCTIGGECLGAAFALRFPSPYSYSPREVLAALGWPPFPGGSSSSGW